MDKEKKKLLGRKFLIAAVICGAVPIFFEGWPPIVRAFSHVLWGVLMFVGIKLGFDISKKEK
ncbi:hypothetical protein [Serratia plymuthica]|uniref:hypothetical protein n=1 Tax=Serratia plymuthica TaxID=82996 RepID=UPI00056B9314|nr:hypothetical protein [Serratia plymuthica]